MEQLPLETPVLHEDLRHVAFWNGRVLTAKDLSDEQTANHNRRLALGRLHGDGVVDGLEVAPGPSPARSVRVRPGMAVAASGDVLELTERVEVRLVPQQDGETGGSGTFLPCETVEGAVTGTGTYLLTIGPGEGTSGSASKVPFGGDGSASECGPRYEVGGVVFRLVELKLNTLAADSGTSANDLSGMLGSEETQERSLARNLLAHLASGSALLDAFYADPFGSAPSDAFHAGPSGSARGVDAVRAAAPKLEEDGVPLALIAWNFDRIGFCDVWSVRRRPTVEPVSTVGPGWPWAVPIAARQVAIGEARLLQFQEHLAWIVDRTTGPDPTTSIDEVRAVDWFRYLPPVAAVPLHGLYEEGSGSGSAFEFTTFFEGVELNRRPVGDGDDSPALISRSRVGALLRASFDHAPIDLTAERSLRVYGIVENREATGSSGAVPYGLVVSDELPFAADGAHEER